MFAKNIATIYFFVVSAASLLLIVVGVFSIVNFIVNSTQYEKYPAQYFREFNCEANPYGPVGPYPVATATPSAKEQDNLKKQCEQNEIQSRRQNKINDLKNAITFPVVGLILFAIHFPIALKRSRES